MAERDHDDRSFVIGLRDLYEQLQILAAGQAAMLGKLDVHIASSNSRIDQLAVTDREHADDYGKLEERVRMLENRQVVTPKSMWTALGVLVAIASLLATIAVNIWGAK